MLEIQKGVVRYKMNAAKCKVQLAGAGRPAAEHEARELSTART